MQKKWLLARSARACHPPHTPTLPRRSRRCWRERSLGRAACGRISLLGRILHPRSFAAAVAFLLAFCSFKRMFAIDFVLGWVEAWASALGVKGYLEQKVIDRRVQRPIWAFCPLSGAPNTPGHGHPVLHSQPGSRGGLTSGEP